MESKFKWVVFSMVFVGLSLIILPSLKKNSTLLTAHPDNKIMINYNTEDEFTLYSDASVLIENSLISQPTKYRNFVQDISMAAVLKKNIFQGIAHGTNAGREFSVNIQDIRRTTGGNYFVLYVIQPSDESKSGGILYFALVNPEGRQLIYSRTGNTTSEKYQNASKFIYSDNNDFVILLGRTGKWFSVSVTGEESGSPKFTSKQDSFIGKGTTGLELNVGKTITIENENSSTPQTVTGTIYPERSEGSGVLSLALPVGTIDVAGWKEGTANFNEIYNYSLLVTYPKLVVGAVEGVINPKELVQKEDGTVYGVIQYNQSETEQDVGYVNTFQIFSKEIFEDGAGNRFKKRVFSHVAKDPETEIIFLKEISNENEVYFFEEGLEASQLFKVNMLDYTVTRVKEFPRKTILKVYPNNDGSLSYFGSTATLYSVFFSSYYSTTLNANYYFVSGLMDGLTSDNPFTVRSVGAAESDTQIYPRFIETITGKTFVAADTNSFGAFISSPIELSNPNHISGSIGITGALEIVDNYAPAILKSSPTKVSINIDDPDIKTTEKDEYGNTLLDNWLISGEKKGDLHTSKLINVYDYYDINQSTDLGSTIAIRQKKFNGYINKNPHNKDLDIDWKALGFDSSRVGPHFVTYYISDTQLLISSTSRWINTIDNKTEKDTDDNVFVKGVNATVKYSETKEQTVNTLKALVKSQAWLGKPIDENNLFTEDMTKATPLFSEKVILDPADVKKIQEATTADKAGAYPLNLTYSDTVSGVTKTVTKKVWIFVTNELTAVTSELIMYANNYRLGTPVENVQESSQKSLLHGGVKVYELETGKLLADETTSQLLTTDDNQLQNIQGELVPQNLPLTYYYKDNNREISTKVTVELFSETETISVFFKDEDGDELASQISIEDQVISSKYDLTKNQEVQEAVDEIISNWYDVSRPVSETEVEVGKLGTKVVYEFKGLIGFKSVTEEMIFEKGYIYPFSQELEYHSSENFSISILDNRGVNTPLTNYQRGQFTINATLTVPFTNDGASTNKVLAAAELVYNDGKSDRIIDDSGVSVYSSDAKTTDRNFIIHLDENGDVSDKGLRLKIPTGTGLELGKYMAEITWDLIQGP